MLTRSTHYRQNTLKITVIAEELKGKLTVLDIKRTYKPSHCLYSHRMYNRI